MEIKILRHGRFVLHAIDAPPARWRGDAGSSSLDALVDFHGHRNAHVNFEDAYAVDGDEGGLIIFSGTDHVHFRPVLRDEYYSVLLLHYCPAAGCDADPFSRMSPFVGLDDG